METQVRVIRVHIHVCIHHAFLINIHVHVHRFVSTVQYLRVGRQMVLLVLTNITAQNYTLLRGRARHKGGFKVSTETLLLRLYT